MAIELTKEKQTGAPLWEVLALLGAAVVLIFFIGTYVYFFIGISHANSKIKQLDASVADLNKNIAQKEQELAFVQKKTDDFKALVASHKNLNNIFALLEKDLIPNVSLDGFNYKSSANNLISFTGTASSPILIGQQIEVLKKENFIKNMALSSLSSNEKGEVAFKVDLELDPKVFSFQI